MMGYASWLVYKNGGDAVPLTLYGIQLFMNLIWTPLFFKKHNLTLALADITGRFGILCCITRIMQTSVHVE